MPTLYRYGNTAITVPDDVADDYRAEGWSDAAATERVVPDSTWTVEQLRRQARAQGVAYSGRRKAELLEALK